MRLAADWARSVPVAARGEDWVRAVELLLVDAIRGEHAVETTLHLLAAQAAERVDAGLGEAAAPDEGEVLAQVRTMKAERLPGHEVARLLKHMVRTARPARDGAAHPKAATLRIILAALLRQTLELRKPGARRIVFSGDLDLVHLDDPVPLLDLLVARAALDLAAVDAAASVPLAERTAAWARIAAVDPWLHRRLLSAHLMACRPGSRAPRNATTTPPAAVPASRAGHDEEGWWRTATALVPELMDSRPTAEGARLVHLMLNDPASPHAAAMDETVRAAFGPPPTAERVAEVIPPAARLDGAAEPQATWLRLWDWSPVLTPGTLAAWEPVLAALRRIAPDGPADPRAAAALEPVVAVPELRLEDLAELADERGPWPRRPRWRRLPTPARTPTRRSCTTWSGPARRPGRPTCPGSWRPCGCPSCAPSTSSRRPPTPITPTRSPPASPAPRRRPSTSTGASRPRATRPT